MPRGFLSFPLSQEKEREKGREKENPRLGSRDGKRDLEVRRKGSQGGGTWLIVSYMRRRLLYIRGATFCSRKVASPPVPFRARKTVAVLQA